MSNHDTKLIALSNETTASQFFYEVSGDILRLIEGLTEAELSDLMPEQAPGGGGYESVMYAAALVKLARDAGLGEDAIHVRPIELPTFFFESGWAGCGGNAAPVQTEEVIWEDVLAEDTDDAPIREEVLFVAEDDIPEDTDTDSDAGTPFDFAEEDGDPLADYVLSIKAGAGLTFGEAADFLRLTDSVDVQMELSDDAPARQRLVEIVRACGRYFAVAPTWRTAADPHSLREWESPYEVEPSTDVAASQYWVAV